MNYVVRLFLALCLLLNQSCKPSSGLWDISIAKYKGDKACAISYTFDDGMKEHYTLVAPMLDMHGFKGTFWLIPGFIERNDGWTATWDEFREMAGNGHEMGNHSMLHKHLTELSLEEAAEDIAAADSLIFEKTGIWPTTFCFPFNEMNADVIGIAGKGRVGLRLSQTALGTASTRENLIAWVDGLLAGREWGVAMIHGITDGYDAFTSPEVLSDHLAYVKQYEDAVWVGTFRDVSAYTAERDNVVFEADRQGDVVVVRNMLELDNRLFDYPLTMVVVLGAKRRIEAKQNGNTLPVRYVGDKALVDFIPGGGDVVLKKL